MPKLCLTVWELPRTEDAPDKLHSLTLNVNPDWIAHPLARCTIEKLQALRRLVNSTTPYDLLSQAVDVLMVRPIVLERHGDQGERAVANIDLYLSMSRSYGVRGLRAFGEAMSALWSDETDAVEGRPDAQEEAVALYSMHAAKGLEWPIVVPINTMTQIRPCGNALVNRATGRFYCPVLGVKPAGYEVAKDAENNELTRERVRLWYVAATRACELLILPRLNVTAGSKEWISILNLDLPSLPVLDLNQFAPGVGVAPASATNGQTREIFATEAAEIVARQETIVWLAPSRNESTKEPVLELEQPAIILPPHEDAPSDDFTPVGQLGQVQGGRERGVLLHKLIEEVLTGETDETTADLQARAAALICAIGLSAGDPVHKLFPEELAASVLRALAVPEVAALRPGLVPEFTVYSSVMEHDLEEATAGIADAIAFDSNGVARAVIDWKSDVAPSPETIDHYRAQVKAYLDMTKASLGLIVLMTSGTVIQVARSPELVAH